MVGLGNPGPAYAANRHNIGFMAVDAIVARHGLGPYRARFQGEAAEGTVAGRKVLILKPMTYMNNSGRSVAAAARFYKMPPEDMRAVVFHDELDLAAGKLRIKNGGGHAGHNGLRSIHAHVGADYGRVRLGIGHPGDKDRVHRPCAAGFRQGRPGLARSHARRHRPRSFRSWSGVTPARS